MKPSFSIQAVQAYYSDEAYQGHCERIEFEGERIMMDIPMTGIVTGRGMEQCKITPVNYPVVSYTCSLHVQLYICHNMIEANRMYFDLLDSTRGY